VEFAAAKFGTRLVVVVGHSQCGAITATLDELLGRSTTESRNLRSIVARVQPSVETVLAGKQPQDYDYDSLVGDAVRANVRASADHLRHGSELLERLVQEDGLLVVGAEYSLESGIVTFFDGVDE
jgi:carbonic anhydrase